MFNHARTLLVNLPGSAGFISNCPGEELIPATYSPLTLPSYMTSIRSRLFGASADRAMSNYRVAQLLQVIATTELQTYITQLDPRITYQLDKLDLADFADFTPRVVRYSGTSSDVLTVTGNMANPDVSGQCGYNFQVRVFSDAGNKLSVTRLTFPLQTNEAALVLTNGLSAEYSLPFSGYRVRVNTLADSAWTVSGFLRPMATLSALFNNLTNLGETSLLQLFGATEVEPYTTFKACWQHHPEFAYRLGGLVLALIYRTEEIRNGG